MLNEKLRIFTRIYKRFDPSFSLICYYSFIFGLLQISIGLSVFRVIANEYQQRAFRLSSIHNIWSAIRWAIPKVILNYSRLPTHNNLALKQIFISKKIIFTKVFFFLSLLWFWHFNEKESFVSCLIIKIGYPRRYQPKKSVHAVNIFTVVIYWRSSIVNWRGHVFMTSRLSFSYRLRMKIVYK
jgi:hypothetical protein